jgi:hypothetical protein
MRRSALLVVALGIVACGDVGDGAIGGRAPELLLSLDGRIAAPERLYFVATPGFQHLDERLVLLSSGQRIRSVALRDDPGSPSGGAAHFALDVASSRARAPDRDFDFRIRYLPRSRGAAGAILEVESEDGARVSARLLGHADLNSDSVVRPWRAWYVQARRPPLPWPEKPPRPNGSSVH